MDLKTALEEARSTLATAATDWTPPTRQQITADPLLCASLLRLGIRRGLPDLASRAAATLLVFDPDRLWRETIRAAVEDIGTPGIEHLWETMAAAKDRRWRRGRGGDWHVVTLVIDRLARTPKCRSAIDLVRLAGFTACEALVVQGGDQLRAHGLLQIKGRHFGNPNAAHQALADEGVPWLWLDGASRAWRVTGSPAALMIPLLWNLHCISSRASVAHKPLEEAALAALTHETPGGRRALSDHLSADPKLRHAVLEPQFAAADPVDTLGRWIARLDFERLDYLPSHEHPELSACLRSASPAARWMIVRGPEVVVAKLPVIDVRRRPYLPPNLTRNGCYRPARGHQ